MSYERRYIARCAECVDPAPVYGLGIRELERNLRAAGWIITGKRGDRVVFCSTSCRADYTERRNATVKGLVKARCLPPLPARQCTGSGYCYRRGEWPIRDNSDGTVVCPYCKRTLRRQRHPSSNYYYLIPQHRAVKKDSP